MTSGLRELYPGVKARASSEWGRFRVSVLQMAVPTSGSVPARPPCRPLAVRPAVGIADRPANGCFSRAAVRQSNRTPDGGGRPYEHPPCCPRGRPPRPSTMGIPSAVRQADRTADGLLRPPAVRQAVHCADGLLPHPRAQQSPSSAANGTFNGRISGEYKEGSTNTLNLLPNLCFPRALSCTLHLLLGKPLLRKSEIVLGVSFGTPNTISTAWLLHSFILYFCHHRNGQQTMVPLVH